MNPRFQILLFAFATAITLTLTTCDNSPSRAGKQRTGGEDEESYEPENAEKAAIPCVRSSRFGDLQLCLPALETMQECLEHPVIDSFLRTVAQPRQIVLGYYQNLTDYAAIDSLRGQTFGDYAMVYSTEQAIGMRFSQTDLEDMFAEMRATMVAESWEKVRKKLNARSEDLSFGELHLLEQYTPTPESMANVMVAPATSTESTDIVGMIISSMRIHDRLICMGFYTTLHNGEADLEQHKAKNTRLVQAILAANP